MYGKMAKLGLIRLEFNSHVLSDIDHTILLELHGHRVNAEKTVVLVSGVTQQIVNKREADPAKVQLLQDFIRL